MSIKRRVAEVGLVIILVVGSLLLGRAIGGVVFPSERGAYAAPEAPAPEVLMARAATGDPRPLVLAERTRPLLVFVLSVDCPFCRQNLPHWRELAAQVAAGGSTAPDLVILSTSGADETAAYLEEHGLPLDFLLVTDEDLDPLEIPGVPATISFSSPEAPMRRWVGVLNATQLEILRAWTASATEKIAVP